MQRQTSPVAQTAAFDGASPGASRPPNLLDQVAHEMRLLHYSRRTEDAYCDWIKRFTLFHGKRHPRAMGAPEVERFLTHLAARKV